MYILFDIGGTKTRIGISKNGKKIDAVNIFPTAKDFKKEMELIKESAMELSDGKKIQAAAGGVASPLNKHRSRIIDNTPSLKWKGKALKKGLEKVLHAQVYAENDCLMVGLGEMQKGAGKKKGIGVYITVSSGVNGARFVDGKPDKKTLGVELGRQHILYKGKSMTLENVISGVALKKRYKKETMEIKSSKAWEEEAKYIALGLSNTMAQWSPDIVVLGGSVMKKVSLLQVKIQLKKILKKFDHLPVIKKSELGDVGGLHGSLHYLNKLKK